MQHKRERQGEKEREKREREKESERVMQQSILNPFSHKQEREMVMEVSAV